MKFRPFSDWVLVKYEPLQKRSSILEVVGESAVRTGVVIRTGPGRPHDSGELEPMEVKEGDRVAFLRWHQEHQPGRATSDTLARVSMELQEDVSLIRQADILFVFEGDIQIDIG